MKTPLTLGPYFISACGAPSGAHTANQVVALGVSLEWAHAERAVTIPLWRHCPSHAPNKLRLENVVVSLTDLPFDVQCSRYQVVDTPRGTFLPMEALLVALYTRYQVARAIRPVLAELASLVTLYNSVQCPLAGKGLLVPRAECRGFQLRTIIRTGGRAYAEIGWQPTGQDSVFHTCLCAFRLIQNGRNDAGQWNAHGVIGVAQLLASELHRLVPGAPDKLFTPSGRMMLRGQISPSHQAVVVD
jgi:hypothetical protein